MLGALLEYKKMTHFVLLSMIFLTEKLNIYYQLTIQLFCNSVWDHINGLQLWGQCTWIRRYKRTYTFIFKNGRPQGITLVFTYFLYQVLIPFRNLYSDVLFFNSMCKMAKDNPNHIPDNMIGWAPSSRRIHEDVISLYSQQF